MNNLSKKTVLDLRRPFAAEAVLVRPLGKPSEKDSKARAAFYIDSRLVVARLNEVVGAENWSDAYRLLGPAEIMNSLYFPVECSLTVFGVTKVDVGQGPDMKLDEKCWKTPYSDALKRAAVKFEVGAYLYAIPTLRAEVYFGADNKAKGFSKAGKEWLLKAYAKWLANPAFNTFGDPLEHGAHTDDEDEPAPLGPGGELPAAPLPVVDYTGTPFDDSAGHPGTSADGAGTGAGSGGQRPTTPAAPQPITKKQKGILEVLGAEVDKLRSTQGKVVGESWFALLSDYGVRDVSELSMEQAVDMASALSAESKALIEFEVPADIQQKLATQ